MKKILLTLLLFATAFSCIAQKAKNVTVSTPDEFIKAIASNTNITLKTNGTLAITSALDKLGANCEVSDLAQAQGRTSKPNRHTPTSSTSMAAKTSHSKT